jgi:hypothetical protein
MLDPGDWLGVKELPGSRNVMSTEWYLFCLCIPHSCKRDYFHLSWYFVMWDYYSWFSVPLQMRDQPTSVSSDKSQAFVAHMQTLCPAKSIVPGSIDTLHPNRWTYTTRNWFGSEATWANTLRTNGYDFFKYRRNEDAVITFLSRTEAELILSELWRIYYAKPRLERFKLPCLIFHSRFHLGRRAGYWWLLCQ